MGNLAERLGYAPDAKLLVVTCDDLGFTHSANIAVYDSVREGIGTSASLMVPCPWSRDAAARYRGEDVGVQITLNSQYETYRWGPITHAPSLLDGDGGFPRTVEDAWDHADLDEVRREARAQIERAVMWGFDASHLVSHLGTLEQRPDFFDVYLELAVDFGLPMRLGNTDAERIAGFPFRRLAAEEGAVFPDHVAVFRPGAQQHVEREIFDLSPGITEIVLHPSADTEEARAASVDWGGRVEDYDYLGAHSSLREMIARAGAELIGWRALRELQRAG
jgi:chitin disaccharide deacetylase